MIPSRTHAALLLAALAAAAAAAFYLRAQPQAANSANNLVFLDPAHGASDAGALLPNNLAEKDLTLAFAVRLRAALAAVGFNVVASRDADPAAPISTDQRAEIANRLHPVACLVLHATATGSGVHLYTSTLQPAPGQPPSDSPASFIPTPWDSAQSAFVSQSQTLQRSLAVALSGAHLPPLAAPAPLRPLDNLMCPAVAVELAPLLNPGTGAIPVSDASYQQQLATTLAAALRTWRDTLPAPAPAAPAPNPAQTRQDVQASQARALAAAAAANRVAARARANVPLPPPMPSSPPQSPSSSPSRTKP